jgi:hypothetical protein
MPPARRYLNLWLGTRFAALWLSLLDEARRSGVAIGAYRGIANARIHGARY